MKEVLKILLEITIDIFRNIKYFIKCSLNAFANILILAAPYVMYVIGQKVAFKRNIFTFGGEIFIPLMFVVLIYYLKSIANKIGKGTTMPLPEKRFTSVDDDGEVSIEHDRIQELLLYTADLEDWMERKGIL